MNERRNTRFQTVGEKMGKSHASVIFHVPDNYFILLLILSRFLCGATNVIFLSRLAKRTLKRPVQ